MSLVLLVIGVASGIVVFISFLLERRKQTRIGQRIVYGLALISLMGVLGSATLSYWGNIETERQLELAQEKATAARRQADKAHAQIAEIRTPRRMPPETKSMLFAKLKRYAGQKYDMKVFRDHDSLELAATLQTIFEEAGWVYTNVYPRHATRYAETDEDGVWVESGKVQTKRTSEAMTALERALKEAGLYDDSSVVRPTDCVEATGPSEQGTKLTRIPCSETGIQITGLDFTVHDSVIREDTLVLHVGRQRL